MLDLERQLRAYGRDLDQRAPATSRLEVPDVLRPVPPRMKTRRAWMVAAALVGITALVAGIVVALDGGQSRLVSTADEPNRPGEGLLFSSPLVFEDGAGGELRTLRPRWPSYFELRSVTRAGPNRFIAMVNEKPWAAEAKYSLVVVDKRGSVVARDEDVGGLDLKLLGANGTTALLQRFSSSADTSDLGNMPRVLFDLETGTERVLGMQENAFAGDVGKQVVITVGTVGSPVGSPGGQGCDLTRVDLSGVAQKVELPSFDCGSGAVVALSPDEDRAAVAYFRSVGPRRPSLRLAVVHLGDGTVELDKRLGAATPPSRSVGFGALGWTRDSKVVRVGIVERRLDRHGNDRGRPGEIEIREISVA